MIPYDLAKFARGGQLKVIHVGYAEAVGIVSQDDIAGIKDLYVGGLREERLGVKERIEFHRYCDELWYETSDESGLDIVSERGRKE